MPLEQDEEEERLARIEQILETVRAEVRPLSQPHQTSIEDARLALEHSKTARTELRRTRERSERQRLRKKKR
jgi:hypothetical protein